MLPVLSDAMYLILSAIEVPLNNTSKQASAFSLERAAIKVLSCFLFAMADTLSFGLRLPKAWKTSPQAITTLALPGHSAAFCQDRCHWVGKLATTHELVEPHSGYVTIRHGHVTLFISQDHDAGDIPFE